MQEHWQPIPQTDERDEQPGDAAVAVGEWVNCKHSPWARAVKLITASISSGVVGGFPTGSRTSSSAKTAFSPASTAPISLLTRRAQTPIFSRLPSFSRGPRPTS